MLFDLRLSGWSSAVSTEGASQCRKAGLPCGNDSSETNLVGVSYLSSGTAHTKEGDLTTPYGEKNEWYSQQDRTIELNSDARLWCGFLKSKNSSSVAICLRRTSVRQRRMAS